MKKIVIFLVLVLSVSAANAWVKHCEEAVVILASENLTPETKALLDKYLGEKYNDDVQYLYALEKAKKAQHTSEIHFLHLNKKLQPKRVKGDDAYAAIEKALAVVAKHESHSKEEVVVALRTIINLMSDIHHVSNVRIDKIEHSKADFKYQFPTSEMGKGRKKFSTHAWSKTWHSYNYYPAGFSAQFRAYDLKVYLGDRFAEFSKGSLKDWAKETGALAKSYLATFKPDAIVGLVERLSLNDVNNEQMVKASCRLAALLNSTLK